MVSRAASNWAFPTKELEVKSEMWKAGPLCVLESGGKCTVNARGLTSQTDQDNPGHNHHMLRVRTRRVARHVTDQEIRSMRLG